MRTEWVCVAESYQDVSCDGGDLQGEGQHIQLTHDLEDQLGVCPRQLQQVQQVRRVAETKKGGHFKVHTFTSHTPFHLIFNYRGDFYVFN